MGKPRFTKEDLSLWGYALDYFLEVLNGEYELEDAIRDLQSLKDAEEEKK